MVKLLDIDLLSKLVPTLGVFIACLGLWLSWKQHRETMKIRITTTEKISKGSNYDAGYLKRRT